MTKFTQFTSKLLLIGGLYAAMQMTAGAAAPAATATQEGAYTVKPGDTLRVSIWKEPDISGPVLVTPDGGFAVPLVGQVDARNKSVTELQQVIVERLKKYIADPVVTISVQEIRGYKVYVIGQVARPNEFVLNVSVDVMQALSMAGGLTPFASSGNITIIRRSGGTQQTFPFDYGNVIKGKNLQQNLLLQSGDVIVVP